MSLSVVSATFTANTAGLTTALAGVDRSVTATAHKVQQMGSVMAVGFGAVAVASGAALGFAVKKAADFEAQMSKVGAIAGASGKDLQRLSDAALKMGASTSYSASEVAKSFEDLAAKGFNTNQIIDAMPGILNAAAASGEDLARVSDVVTSAINGFGMSAKDATKVADIMAMTANRSAASVDDLGYAFKYSSPIAKTLGFDITWLAASVGVMADAGIEGSSAGTTLRMSLSRLASPTKAVQKELTKMGVSLQDANGKAKPIPQVLNEVMNSLRGMGKEQRVAAASTLFGTESMSGMLTLVAKSPAEFAKLQNALKNSGGMAAKTAAQMKDNLKGSLEQLSGAFESLQISIGATLAPAIRKIADGLTSIVNKFNGMSQPMKNFVTGVLVVTFILSTLGFIAGGVSVALGALAAAFTVSIGTVAAWAGGIAGGIIAVIAIAGALVYAYNHFEGFRNVVDNTWNAIKAGFQAVASFLQPAITAVTSFFIQKWSEITQWWGEVWPNLSQAFQNIWSVISSILRGHLMTIVALFQIAWPIISTVIQVAWEIIKAVISTAINLIMDIVNIFAAIFTGNWSMLWGNIKDVFVQIWNLIVSVLSAVWSGIVALAFIIFGPVLAFFTYIWNAVAAFFSSVWQSIKTTAMTVWNAIVTFVTNIWNSIKTTATTIWNAIKDFVVSAFAWMYNHNYYFKALVDFIVNAWNTAKAFTLNVWNAVKSFLSSVWNGIKSVATTVFNAVKSFLISVWNAIKSRALAVWNEIKREITTAVNAVKSVVTSVWNAIKSATSTAWNAVKKTVSDIWNSIVSTLSGLADDASSWGSNLLSMFISGIKSKIKDLGGVLKDVAGKVAGYLGFHSPTKEGPASDSDTWAPNFVEMFAGGLKRGTPVLLKVASGLAAQMAALNGQTITTRFKHSLSTPSLATATGAQTADNTGGILITGNTFHVRNDNDIERIARAIDRQKQTQLRAKGRF